MSSMDKWIKAHYMSLRDFLHSSGAPCVSFRWSHIFLSLSCRDASPVLPTHDREDPLANVNARITVFIAQAPSFFLSFSIASSPPINTYAQYVVRRSPSPGNRPWPSAAPETIPGRAFRRPSLHHHHHHHHHRKVNHRRRAYLHARRSTSLSLSLSLPLRLLLLVFPYLRLSGSPNGSPY